MKNYTMATQRILWTKEEKETVFRTLQRDAIENKQGFVTSDLNKVLGMWREAQRFLPLDRRRPSGINNVMRDLHVVLNLHWDYDKIADFSEQVERVEVESDEFKIKPGTPVRQPVEKATWEAKEKLVKKVEEKTAEAVQAVTQNDEVKSSMVSLLGGTIVDKAMSEIIDRLVGALEQRLVVSITDKVLENLGDMGVVDYATNVDAERKVLPKILVCGPLPKQQQELTHYFDGVAKLKFVASDDKAHLVSTRGRNCDMAVVWTNFVNHSTTDHTLKTFGKKVTLAKGGMQTLRETIEEAVMSLI